MKTVKRKALGPPSFRGETSPFQSNNPKTKQQHNLKTPSKFRGKVCLTQPKSRPALFDRDPFVFHKICVEATVLWKSTILNIAPLSV